MSMKRDSVFMIQFHGKPCIVCGVCLGTHGHHILTKKARPDLKYELFNIAVLCFHHHREIHDKGRMTFIKKYNLIGNMIERGFEYCPFRDDIFLPISEN